MASGPVTPLPERASDSERNRIARTLRDRAVEGRISVDTFSRRLDRLYLTRDHEQLEDLVRDLPPRRLFRRLFGNAVASVSALGREAELAWNRPRVARLELPLGSTNALTIGRSPECDFQVSDPSVSRRHASLRHTEDGWVIEDEGSLNGTRVNGLRIVGSTNVRRGDLVAFGREHIRIA